MKTLIKISVASFALLSLIVFSGCNTVQGLGEDFEQLGESMQRAGE